MMSVDARANQSLHSLKLRKQWNKGRRHPFGARLKRADFIRQYQKVDGFWLPLCDETQVHVKLYGKRVFTIDHGQYVIQSQWKDKTKIE
jgi:hypothetical protein